MSEMNSEQNPVARLGDASVASPFICRSISVAPVVDIVRQGRATLVSTHEMYRILALYSLINAFELSVLYFEGVQMSDKQGTFLGILTAFCFLFITRSEPLEKLSRERPNPKLFNAFTLLSVAGQLIVHVACTMYTVNFTKSYLPPDYVPSDPDSDFKPTLINSTVLLISAACQIASFMVNHRGHPFMQNLFENKGLLLCLMVLSALMWVCAMEVVPSLNEYCEFVKFPSDTFRYTLLIIIAADFALSFIVDRLFGLFLY